MLLAWLVDGLEQLHDRLYADILCARYFNRIQCTQDSLGTLHDRGSVD